MKKLIISLVLFCTSAFTVSAQDIFNEVLRFSTEEANKESNNIEVRLINTFQADALKYMLNKTAEVMPETTMDVLDRQALALFNFVQLYVTRLSASPREDEQKVVIARFSNASLYNKRFNDTDRELVEAYLNNPRYMTRFSLDTDWEQALAEVEKVYR